MQSVPSADRSSFWTSERDAFARRLWLAGASAKEIAASLQAPSASAVVSRMWRRGWRRPPVCGWRPAPCPSVQVSRTNCQPARSADFDAVIAAAPRPWLSRSSGQCAFPVDGDGWTVRSCCNPCPGAVYCEAHRAVMRGGAGATAVQMERSLRRRLG
jgi:hypothetical protein